MTGQCKCCDRTKDLRIGFCFDCAEAESIIKEGTDMYDEPIPIKGGMSESMSKLRYILRKYIDIKTK
jgi:hypothetical protein